MKNILFCLVIVASALLESCCASADCGDSELTFSIAFVTPESNYYYFNQNDEVSYEFFYGDTTFIRVDKEISGEGDSTFVRFFAYLDLEQEQYSILANDTLFGTLDLSYGLMEQGCCGSQIGIEDYTIDTRQEFQTDFGFQVILD